jgi:hypothetical protein
MLREGHKLKVFENRGIIFAPEIYRANCMMRKFIISHLHHMLLA